MPSEPPEKSTAPRTSSAVGAVLLIAQQFASRGLTFVVNQILLRYLSPELLGTSTQLEVYSITVLFFARESLRVALQRQTDTAKDVPKKNVPTKEPHHVDGESVAGKIQTVVNLGYVSLSFGVLFALGLGWVYLRTLSSGDPAVLATPYFFSSLRLYALAAIVELLAEPAYLVVQQKSRWGIRATVESTATVLRCIGNCATALWAHRAGMDIGVLPFAIGQMLYSISLVIVYLWKVAPLSLEDNFSLMAKPIRSSNAGFVLSYFSRPLLSLSGSFFFQSIFKHILTQGDTLLIAALASPQAQGVYALANNYGGLVARLVLQPLEEMSRNFFGKLLSSPNQASHKELVSKSKTTLLQLLHTYIILSVFIIAVGPTIAPLGLNLIAGSRWTASGAGDVLATYCYYIPLLAINGLTEAFVSSVATELEVHRQTAWMLAFSAGFGGAAFIFLSVLNLGAEGLVWANALNMIFRIVWCTAFIQSYLRQWGTGLEFGRIMPKVITTAAGLGAYAVLRQMRSSFQGGSWDLIKSGVVAGLLLVVIVIIEHAHIRDCYRSFKSED